jgi:hypothetical protein
MTVCYQISLTLTKVSILCLYLRVLTYSYAPRATYVLLAVVIVYNIWGFCMQMTNCIPLEKTWDPSLHGSCHPEVFLWAVVGLHIATDFLIFFLPLPIFFIVTMPLQQKISLFILFGLGFLYVHYTDPICLRALFACPSCCQLLTFCYSTCLISILRAIWIKDLFVSKDFTWDFVSIVHWTCVEVNIAIVCACLMTVKPFIGKFWPWWLHPRDGYEQQASDPHGRPMSIGTRPSRPKIRPESLEFMPETWLVNQKTIPDADSYVLTDLEIQADWGKDDLRKPVKAQVKEMGGGGVPVKRMSSSFSDMSPQAT